LYGGKYTEQEVNKLLEQNAEEPSPMTPSPTTPSPTNPSPKMPENPMKD
jgi:hypothetical protein